MHPQKPFNELERKAKSKIVSALFSNVWYGDICFDNIIDENDYVRFWIPTDWTNTKNTKNAYEIKVDRKTRNLRLDTIEQIY